MKIHVNFKFCNKIAKLVGNYNLVIVFSQKFYKFTVIIYLSFYKILALF